MNLSTMYVAEIVHRERLVQAEQAHQYAQHTMTIRLPDRVRQALGAYLISWGERLYVPTFTVDA